MKPPLPTDRARRNTTTDTKIGKGIDVALVTLVFLGLDKPPTVDAAVAAAVAKRALA